MKRVNGLVWAFVALQSLDGLTTFVAISSGRGTENNPLFDNSVNQHPILAFVIKAAFIGLVLGCWRRFPRMFWSFLWWWLVAVSAIVVIMNIGAIA